MCPIANEDPLGIVQDVQPEGSYIWDGSQMTSYHKKLKVFDVFVFDC